MKKKQQPVDPDFFVEVYISGHTVSPQALLVKC